MNRIAVICARVYERIGALSKDLLGARKDTQGIASGTKASLTGMESPSNNLAGIHKTPYRHMQNTLRVYAKSPNPLRKIRQSVAGL